MNPTPAFCCPLPPRRLVIHDTDRLPAPRVNPVAHAIRRARRQRASSLPLLFRRLLR